MTAIPIYEDPPRLLGVAIGRYKNLEDAWLPWTDGIAIFGANGSGKTNLLEALAILLGTQQTLLLTHRRLQKSQPNALSVIMQVSASDLPWAPDRVLPLELEAFKDELLERITFLQRASDDRDWWRAIGATGGEDFLAGLTSVGTPQEVLDFLADQIHLPVVRYGLTEFRHVIEPGLDEVDDPTTNTLYRRWSRTLMASDVPQWLRQLAPTLPDVFSPLRTDLADQGKEHAGFLGLLTLPDLPDRRRYWSGSHGRGPVAKRTPTSSANTERHPDRLNRSPRNSRPFQWRLARGIQTSSGCCTVGQLLQRRGNSTSPCPTSKWIRWGRTTRISISSTPG